MWTPERVLLLFPGVRVLSGVRLTRRRTLVFFLNIIGRSCASARHSEWNEVRPRWTTARNRHTHPLP